MQRACGIYLLAEFCVQGIAKAGVNARLDAHKMLRDLNVGVEGVVELTAHPVALADLQHQSRSLASEGSSPVAETS